MRAERECSVGTRGPTPESMRHARSIALLSLLTLLATAPFADARKPRPYVKSVSPLRASVGEEMTIQGFYFTPGYAENTVVFVAKDGRVSYVRSEHSTKTTIKVIVPKKIERLLPRDRHGLQVPTKFRIKVIARRMSRLAKGVAVAADDRPRRRRRLRQGRDSEPDRHRRRRRLPAGQHREDRAHQRVRR